MATRQLILASSKFLFQSPISYIRSHEQVIFEAGSSPGEPCDIFHSEAADIGLARKRKASER